MSLKPVIYNKRVVDLGIAVHEEATPTAHRPTVTPRTQEMRRT